MTADTHSVPSGGTWVDGSAAYVVAQFQLEAMPDPDQARFHLRVRDDRLELLDRQRPGFDPLCVDFALPARLRRLRQGDSLLRRACRLRGATGPVALDATAGLGGDSLMLASFGFRVMAWERSGVVAALLADGLRRARAIPGLAGAAERIHLHEGDARGWLKRLPTPVDGAVLPRPELVYLDPMFGGTRRALPGREMQFLADLVGTDDDAHHLLGLSRQLAIRRVVVKRAPHAVPLAEGPTRTVHGKQVRYDIYDATGGG